MTECWWNDAERDETHEAAADWFARLQRADISPAELLAWQRWLAANPRNAEAFARLEEVCALLRTRGRPASPASQRFLPTGYDGSMAIGEWQVRSRRRSWMAIAASVGIALFLVSWVAREHGMRSAAGPQVVQTGVGENRTVQLADGSRVTLGGDTQVSARFNATGREIELGRGEAYFAVAKDPTRPFWVRVGQATVTAVGTEFNVRRRQDDVSVTVVEGQVVIEPSPVMVTASGQLPRRSSPAPLKVSAGEKIVIGEGDVQQPIRVDDAGAAAAWRSGRLIFDREPLRDVVEDVNRYSPKRIVIEEAAIGDLMFTGTVMDGNVESWISSIERIFSLDAVEGSEGVLLRRRAD